MSTRVELVFSTADSHTAAMNLLAERLDLALSYADAVGLALAHGRGITDAFTLDRAWSACGVTLVA